MKQILFSAALLSAAILPLAPVSAQTTTVTTTPGGGAVVVSPEQRTTIRTYVTQRNVKPVTIRERVAVGGTLPADVELQAVPAEWGPSYGSYRYVYSGNQVYFVEPSSRRVVYVVD